MNNQYGVKYEKVYLLHCCNSPLSYRGLCLATSANGVVAQLVSIAQQIVADTSGMGLFGSVEPALCTHWHFGGTSLQFAWCLQKGASAVVCHTAVVQCDVELLLLHNAEHPFGIGSDVHTVGAGNSLFYWSAVDGEVVGTLFLPLSLVALFCYISQYLHAHLQLIVIPFYLACPIAKMCC